MKTQIDIVTGLLGSGKTHLINRLVAFGAKGSGMVVLQCEQGLTNLQTSESVIHTGRKRDETTCQAVKRIIRDSSPKRILIEHSGTESITSLIQQLQTKELRGCCRIRRIFFLASCKTLSNEYKCCPELVGEQIEQADVMVLTGTGSCNRQEIHTARSVLSMCNTQAEFYDAQSEKDFKNLLLLHGKPVEKRKRSDSIFWILLFGGLIFCYLIFEALRSFSPSAIQIPDLQTFNTVFLSILFEAFPFILVGVFVSSLIQILIPARVIERALTRNIFLGFAVALFGGLVFPVCDCATVPVAARLMRKGAPTAVAVTFLLAAPLVNPIVIISTLYAFPGYPVVALCRIATGLLVALLAGISFLWGISKDPSRVLSGFDAADCDCESCSGAESAKGFWPKTAAVLRHTANEFFEVGIFLIIGAMISAILQVYLPKPVWTNLGGNPFVAVLAMMGAAFILSICSTSDAFIARTFANSIPIASVMAFMVLGPMLDFKNLMLLSGNFKKRFVARLVATICVISFLVLIIMPDLFFSLSR